MLTSRLKIISVSMALIVLTACAGQPIKTTHAPEIKRMSAEELAKITPQSEAKLSLEDIVRETKAGMSPDQLIEKINKAGAYYALTPAQAIDLHQQGVDTKVLDYLYQANERSRQNAIAQAINKQQQAQDEQEKILKHQRDIARMRAMDAWLMYRHYPWAWRSQRWGLGYGLGW